MQKLADEITADKISDLNEKINKIDDEISQDPSEQKEQLESERTHYEQEIAYLEAKTESANLLDLYCLLECDEPAKYRRKMSGIVLPFNTRDKAFRIPTEAPSRKYRFRSEKTAQQIRQEVARLRRVRMDKEKAKEKQQIEKYARTRIILRQIREQQIKQRFGLPPQDEKEEEEEATSTLKSKSRTEELPKGSEYRNTPNRGTQSKSPGPQKLTWQLLKNITYKDIAPPSNEDGFKLADFVNENSAEAEEGDDIVKKVATHMPPPRTIHYSVPRGNQAPRLLPTYDQYAGKPRKFAHVLVVAAAVSGTDPASVAVDTKDVYQSNGGRGCEKPGPPPEPDECMLYRPVEFAKRLANEEYSATVARQDARSQRVAASGMYGYGRGKKSGSGERSNISYDIMERAMEVAAEEKKTQELV